jgi:hypothetical protein
MHKPTLRQTRINLTTLQDDNLFIYLLFFKAIIKSQAEVPKTIFF